jgi:Gpi18-like mannosyltransferase
MTLSSPAASADAAREALAEPALSAEEEIRAERRLALRRVLQIALVGCAVALALVLRYTLIPFESEDFTYFFLPWSLRIRQEGVLALARAFANYQPLYLYLLALTNSLPIPVIWSVKVIAIAGDLALAWYTYRLVRVRFAPPPPA